MTDLIAADEFLQTMQEAAEKVMKASVTVEDFHKTWGEWWQIANPKNVLRLIGMVPSWIEIKEGCELPEEREMVLVWTSIAGVILSSWFKWECMEEPLWHNMPKEFGKPLYWQRIAAPALGERDGAK